MTTNPSEHAKHGITYVVLGIIFLSLAIIALGVFHAAKASVQANQKADQLIAAIEAKGYPAPDKNQITRVLGEDGGAVCADPNNALRHAVLHSMMVNGAGGPGTRPVITDQLAVRGQLLIMQVYCPDKVAEFEQYANQFKFDEVVKQ